MRGLGFLTLLLFGPLVFAQETTRAPGGWAFNTPGRILTDALVTEDHRIIGISEDKSLYVLNRQGELVHRWTLGQRFQPFLLGTEERVFVFTLDYRVVCLDFPPGQGPRVLWTYGLDSEVSAAPALDAYGNLYVGTKKNGLYALGPTGQLLWSSALGSPIRSMVALGGYALQILQSGVLKTLDLGGRLQGQEISVDPVYQDFLLGSRGQRVLWGQNRGEILTSKGQSQGKFQTPGAIHQVILDPQENILAATAGGALLFGPQGNFLRVLNKPDTLALAQSQKGLWALTKNQLLQNFSEPGLKIPLENQFLTLGPQGLGVVCGSSWHFYTFVLPPGFPGLWNQNHGGPLKNRSLRSPADEDNLMKYWEKDYNFVYLMKLAASRDPEAQGEVLAEMEKKLKAGVLKREWPYASLVLLRIALGGVVFVDSPANPGQVNFPTLRARAYQLLGALGDLEARNLVITGLRKEFDPFALRMAVRALGAIGFDFDGEGSRALKEAFNRQNRDEALALSLITSIQNLLRVNQRVPDPVLVEVLGGIYMGNFTPKTRSEAQKVFQSLIRGDFR